MSLACLKDQLQAERTLWLEQWTKPIALQKRGRVCLSLLLYSTSSFLRSTLGFLSVFLFPYLITLPSAADQEVVIRKAYVAAGIPLGFFGGTRLNLRNLWASPCRFTHAKTRSRTRRQEVRTVLSSVPRSACIHWSFYYDGSYPSYILSKNDFDDRHLFWPNDLDLSLVWVTKIVQSNLTGKERASRRPTFFSEKKAKISYKQKLCTPDEVQHCSSGTWDYYDSFRT